MLTAKTARPVSKLKTIAWGLQKQTANLKNMSVHGALVGRTPTCFQKLQLARESWLHPRHQTKSKQRLCSFLKPGKSKIKDGAARLELFPCHLLEMAEPYPQGTHLTTAVQGFPTAPNSGPAISLLRKNFSLPFPNSKPENIPRRQRRSPT